MFISLAPTVRKIHIIKKQLWNNFCKSDAMEMLVNRSETDGFSFLIHHPSLPA